MIFETHDSAYVKKQALQWAASFNVCCYLDSNHYTSLYSKFDVLLAVGVQDQVTAFAADAFEALKAFRMQHNGWITGFMGYDLKNELEDLESNNADNLQFPDLYFFSPLHLIMIEGNKVEIISDDAVQVWNDINQQTISRSNGESNVNLQSRFTREAYIDTFNQIKQHINRGDIYVTNLCQEFYAENAVIDPLDIFHELNRVSPTPFASFLKYNNQYIICASPERFMAKRGNKLISQPIKGTARRGSTPAEDKAIQQALRSNLKEQQENVMIVDLVRNDLTKSALPGTVQTEELFGIYSFEQVHQMISTITCQAQTGISVIDAVRNTFPMGSMTGAPKLRAMQLIEHYERSRRGVYSGAIGYFNPDNDFDFNVVIRTLFYNANNKYLSFQVGSAITFDAVAEQEYAECLLKAKAIMEVLGVNKAANS
ncbi:anthranilate synthase component I family protein [Mucilaginibacter sp. PAMB04274]|uniref:anthranilate synthase component I family protein n=1 Tax=Mucilaginibacter sp. PAMB04274 TaxID=3138568 RepID=UPI0031F684C4